MIKAGKAAFHQAHAVLLSTAAGVIAVLALFTLTGYRNQSGSPATQEILGGQCNVGKRVTIECTLKR